MIDYLTKRIIDTETDVDYEDNEGELETNYEEENETHYGDLEDICLEDVDLEIIYNNTLLFLPQIPLRPSLISPPR